MAAHARLKNEFTEDEKYHNLMRWLILFLKIYLDIYIECIHRNQISCHIIRTDCSISNLSMLVNIVKCCIHLSVLSTDIVKIRER